MYSSSGSGKAGNLSWPSFPPFEVNVYLRNCAESLDARRFQGMPAGEDRCIVCDVPHGANCNTQVGACIKRQAHWGGRGVAFRQGNASWFDRPFLRCTAERGYIVRIILIVAQFVAGLSGSCFR